MKSRISLPMRRFSYLLALLMMTTAFISVPQAFSGGQSFAAPLLSGYSTTTPPQLNSTYYGVLSGGNTAIGSIPYNITVSKFLSGISGSYISSKYVEDSSGNRKPDSYIVRTGDRLVVVNSVGDKAVLTLTVNGSYGGYTPYNGYYYGPDGRSYYFRSGYYYGPDGINHYYSDIYDYNGYTFGSNVWSSRYYDDYYYNRYYDDYYYRDYYYYDDYYYDKTGYYTGPDGRSYYHDGGYYTGPDGIRHYYSDVYTYDGYRFGPNVWGDRYYDGRYHGRYYDDDYYDWYYYDGAWHRYRNKSKYDSDTDKDRKSTLPDGSEPFKGGKEYMDHGGMYTASNMTGTRYSDVSSGDWFAEAVNFVVGNNIMSPVTMNRFAPYAPMTRGTLVDALYNLAGRPAVSGRANLRDARGTGYEDAVVWAVNNGIIAGFPDGSFRGQSAVTREQMVTILYNYARVKGGDLSAGNAGYFGDSSYVSAYARPAVNWAVTHGYLSGAGNNNIFPRTTTSRAQMASILHRFSQQV